MITLSQLTELLGWVSVVNIFVLFLIFITLTTIKKTVISIHSKMFDIKENELNLIYFEYIASYKKLTFIFILSPYIALKIMGH